MGNTNVIFIYTNREYINYIFITYLDLPYTVGNDSTINIWKSVCVCVCLNLFSDAPKLSYVRGVSTYQDVCESV